MMELNRSHICDHCKDEQNLVTPTNGGVIIVRSGSQKKTLAYVHNSCQQAWAQDHGAVTLDKLGSVNLEKTIQCARCGRVLEVSGNQKSDNERGVKDVSCPYDDCGEPAKVRWPEDQPLFVRIIRSEM
jgi:hypothetical protein